MTQATKTRKATIIVAIRKSSGIVCAKVRGDSGHTYFVKMVAGRESCTCEGNSTWRRRCYHIKAVSAAVATIPTVEQIEATAPVDTIGLVMTQANESMTAAIKAAAVAGDKAYAEVVGYGAGKPTWGTCGHLSKNENDDCGACKSRAWR